MFLPISPKPPSGMIFSFGSLLFLLKTSSPLF